MKQILLAILLSFAATFSAYAGDTGNQGAAQLQNTVFVTQPRLQLSTEKPLQLLTEKPMTPTLVSNKWHFVGCVQSHHSCKHHARNHGYHHHYVTNNHHRCHHEPHLACYGRN